MILKVDISNAYNTISRAEGVRKYCPDIARWAHWCLNGNSRVYYNTRLIPCSTGVQQGDPLAPVLFSVGLHKVIEQLLAVPEIRQLWFLDDGILRGRRAEVQRALTIMTCELNRIHLRINQQKSEVYLPTTSGCMQSGVPPADLDTDAIGNRLL